jgi:hypothetical protein
MFKFGTGAQAFPLLTGNNNNPTLAQGSPTRWFLNTIPDRVPTGPLAYVLGYLLLTISGTIVQPASGGSALYFDDLTGALIDSIDWTGSWFGAPASQKWVTGANMPVTSFIAAGYRTAMRQRPAIPVTAGTYPFRLSVAIPAANLRLGGLMRETSQLALLFKDSMLDVNVADADVLDLLSDGATFGTLTARLSAICYPSSELILGTPVEQILHQVTAGGGNNNNQVTIEGFGTQSALTNVKKKGGVCWLGELTNASSADSPETYNPQGGVFAAEDVTRFEFSWRGQKQVQHIEAMLSPMFQAQGNSRPQTQPGILSGGDSEFTSFPYTNSKSDQGTTAADREFMDFTGLRILPFVYGDDDLQLADLQTADTPVDYALDVDGGFASGAHQLIGFYAKAFEEGMRNDWVRAVTDNGKGGLAAYVLGQQWAKAQIGQRLPPGRHVITRDQEEYLAWQLG